MTLLFRQNTLYHSSIAEKPIKKVLVKQSYVLLMWVSYLAAKNKETNTKTTVQGSANSQTEGNKPSPSMSLKKTPSLFVKPFRNYKTTILRAPMAHKTFSQEQFMVRYYKLNLSFNTRLFKKNKKNNLDFGHALDFNSSFYFALKIKRLNPIFSTNMLMLHSYKVCFVVTDLSFTKIF